jgi:hypothetical protein
MQGFRYDWLEWLIDRIDTDARCFFMSGWFAQYAGEDTPEWDCVDDKCNFIEIVGFDPPVPDLSEEPPACGMALCICGHLNFRLNVEKSRRNDFEISNAQRATATVLGFDYDTVEGKDEWSEAWETPRYKRAYLVVSKMYFTSSWPGAFRRLWAVARTPEERARVGILVLRDTIEKLKEVDRKWPTYEMPGRWWKSRLDR